MAGEVPATVLVVSNEVGMGLVPETALGAGVPRCRGTGEPGDGGGGGAPAAARRRHSHGGEGLITARGWLWAPLIALQFLTRIPVRGVPDWAYDEAGGKRAALAFFPVVGIVVATIAAAVYEAGTALGLRASWPSRC